MAVNPLAPFSCPEPVHRPLPVSSWATVKAIFDGTTNLRLEVGDPADLRLTLILGGAFITATGVDDVGELIECFQLGDEASVSYKRSGFTLVQDGDIVLYRDASSEVRIPRGSYDRLAALVTDLVPDRSVQDAFEETTLRLARQARAPSWHPGPIAG
ncbi:hypothetical protein VQ02_34435, partial [Methylobacterium variabile]